MLIHKKTMGVLSTFWSGKYRTVNGEKVPIMVEYTFQNTDLNPDDWWFVSARSPIGKRVTKLYPCCDPVTDEAGELIAVKGWKKEKENPAPEVKKSRQRRRKSGIFESLLQKGEGGINT